MKRELIPTEILFNLTIDESEEKNITEFDEAYNRVGRALNIDREGYNLYLVDSFSKEKIKELIDYVNEEYKHLSPPKDICYVTLTDEKKPEAIFVKNGKGEKLKEVVNNIKEYYIEIVAQFYNESSYDEKDKIIDDIQDKRSDYISELMDMAKDAGFEVKDTSKGFAFIPLIGDEAMTEKEYDDLDKEKQDSILLNASNLKKKAENVLDSLKDIELKSMSKLKKIYKKFITINMEGYKDDALLEFITDDESYEYLERLFELLESDIIECYTMNIEDDETTIYEVFNKYSFKVLVDNKENSHPVVIYEEDPNINNLMGIIEYENKNGIYSTDISLINSGSILRANEGCLILRVNSLAVNPYSYNFLKKTLITNKLSYDMSKSYLEFLSINGLKPCPIPVSLKVIIIGDYETYDLLYSSDEEFRTLFPLRAEFNNTVDISNNSVGSIRNYLENRSKINNTMRISDDGIKEVFKYLCRKSGSKKKINLQDYEVDRLMILANNHAKENGNRIITENDIIQIAYEKESIEKEYIKMYEEKKMLCSVVGRRVGAINALAVIDTGYCSFGKPMRITSIVCNGSGNIIDTQKESKLSGRIHEKSVNILYGLIKNLLDPYKKLPINFHLSFEQTYGLVDGDSASVAETIAMLSALSKKGVKQNIAVTGSLNQFGEVQVIGGATEKIEGYYNVCKLIDKVEGKGVLIPYGNREEVILRPEVEESISKGEFKIYTMDTLDDAIEVLLLDEDEKIEDFYKLLKEEMKKYESDDKK